MLSTSSFVRTEVWKASAKLISGLDWLTVNKDGKASVMTTGDGVAPTPPCYVLMALGACAGNGVKFLLEKAGKTIRDIKVDVEGEWDAKPQRRISEIRMSVKADADVTEEELAKIVKQVEDKMCPVAGTLKYPTTLKSTVQVAHN